MQKQKFEKSLYQNFGFTPTQDQAALFSKWGDYLFDNQGNQTFILGGYAGTGKTTCIKALVKTLPKFNRKSVLLAPTGRAAKVMQVYSRKSANTIHRYIYRSQTQKGGSAHFKLKENKAVNTVYIVDEASMIPDVSMDNRVFGDRSLLEDLILFVSQGIGCKLILVGDIAQLPPVGLELSPALNPDVLKLKFNREVIEHYLNQVMRQETGSNILDNATLVRNLQEEVPEEIHLVPGRDFIRLEDGWDIQEKLESAFSGDEKDDSVFIVRSNKRANAYNEAIRSRILFQENEISAGDRIMVVKNNYFWLDQKSKAGFLANGENLEVLSLTNHQEMYGFHFVDATLRLIDYPGEPSFEAKLLLDTLKSESPSLTYEQSKKFFEAVIQDYADLPRYKQFQKLKENEFFNALQIKFAYAVTCHKAQGGQWKTVFIEQSWLPDGINHEYLRWLYTAITRAQNQAYLIGFKDDFFE